MTPADEEYETGAELSADGVYRYALWRTWTRDKPPALFVMLNPSTADVAKNDPTIRKCIGFAKRWECGGIYVINLFGVRCTNPRGLRYFQDIVGPSNLKAQRRAVYLLTQRHEQAGPCVVAWGNQPKIVMGDAPLAFAEFARVEGVRLQCLGANKNGSPKHPLMLPYSTPLQDWRPA